MYSEQTTLPLHLHSVFSEKISDLRDIEKIFRVKNKGGAKFCAREKLQKLFFMSFDCFSVILIFSVIHTRRTNILKDDKLFLLAIRTLCEVPLCE